MSHPPKPLTLVKAKPILFALFRPAKVHLRQQGALCALYLDDESEARHFGSDWEEVIKSATLEKYKDEN